MNIKFMDNWTWWFWWWSWWKRQFLWRCNPTHAITRVSRIRDMPLMSYRFSFRNSFPAVVAWHAKATLSNSWLSYDLSSHRGSQ